MDPTKQRSEILLRLLGHEPIYEPFPNECPDFSCASTAVEVTRLTKSMELEGQTAVLDSDRTSFLSSIGNLLESFDGRESNESWFVGLNYRRPFNLRADRQAFRSILNQILDGASPPTGRTKVSNSITIDFSKATFRSGKPFLLGGHLDHDQTGWLIPDLAHNINRISIEKAARAETRRNDFSEWWLLMENHISLSLDDNSANEVREIVNPDQFWSKIFVFDRLEPSAFQVIVER